MELYEYNRNMHAWFFEDIFPDSLKKAFGVQGLPAYGVMIFLAIICSAICFLILYKQFGFSKSKALWLLVYLAVFGLLGAHVFSLLFRVGEIDFSSWQTFGKTAWQLFASLMYYGGFLGGLIGLFIYEKKEGISFYKAADMAVIVLPLAHAIGRVGCYLAGCCYGAHTDKWYGVDFIYGHSHGTVVPTQLFEVIFNSLLFIVFILIFVLFYRKHFVKRSDGMPNDNKFMGLFTTIYLLAYPVYRFIVEFFRDDNRGNILGLSTSQFISIFLFAYGVYLLIKLIKRTKGQNFQKVMEVEREQADENDNN